MSYRPLARNDKLHYLFTILEASTFVSLHIRRMPDTNCRVSDIESLGLPASGPACFAWSAIFSSYDYLVAGKVVKEWQKCSASSFDILLHFLVAD